MFDPSIRVNEIQLGSQVKRLSLGNTLTPSVSMLPSFAGNRNVNWSSADPAVASVDPVTGRVKGSGVGSTTITATAADGGGATASYTIDVIEGPAAHYTFDGNLKNANSLFGAGTITGNHIDSAGGTVTFASGVSDQAAVFDGNSGVRLPNGLISGNNYSVSIWVNPAQLTTYTPAFFGAKDGNNWVSLVPQGSAGNQTMVWSGSSWYDAPTGMSIPAGEWTHLAFTVEKGSIRVYVNGAAKFAGTNFPDVFSAAGAIFGLAVNWWDTPFKGMMDDMRVYDGALSPAAVAGLAGISQP
ncbi:LamG-like jellyroll fold domain-containing protein [Cohnella suwonensis]|uniref:LamG-like jellyroll fold domain-containing protein n=1 Tax=Cohnella suwonensis TaxID=696072 RepID=A0ABW0LY45_9BACL